MKCRVNLATALFALAIHSSDALLAEEFNTSLVRSIYAKAVLATRVHRLVTQARGGPSPSTLDVKLLSLESGPVSRIRLQRLEELATAPQGSVIYLTPAEGTIQSPQGTVSWFSVEPSWQVARELPVDFKQTYAEMCAVNPDLNRFTEFVRVRLRATLGEKSITYTATYLFPEPDSNMRQFQPLDYTIQNFEFTRRIVAQSVDPEPVVRGYRMKWSPEQVQSLFQAPQKCVPEPAAKEICCVPGTLECGLTKYRNREGFESPKAGLSGMSGHAMLSSAAIFSLLHGCVSEIGFA